jgi:hypothetical protein
MTQEFASIALRSERWQSDRRFYCGMAWTIGLLVVASFSKALLRDEFEPGALNEPLTQAHAFVFFSWIALFVIQATLIGARRPDIHRRLGALGVVIACAMVVLATLSTIRMFSLGLERFFFANPHVEVIVFTALISPAFLFRRDAEMHKRLVLLATIALIGAATAHLPFVSRIPYLYLVLQDSFIAAGIVYDLVSRRRVHPAYIWGTLLILVSQLWVAQQVVQTPMMGRK